MDEQPVVYLSYLLRLWRVSGMRKGAYRVEKRPLWRASLESSRIGGRRVFADLNDLFDFLQQQVDFGHAFAGGEHPGALDEQPDYLSYLLRLWRVSDAGGGPVWRASLESARTGERRDFDNPDDLLDFLREQTGLSAGA